MAVMSLARKTLLAKPSFTCAIFSRFIVSTTSLSSSSSIGGSSCIGPRVHLFHRLRWYWTTPPTSSSPPVIYDPSPQFAADFEDEDEPLPHPIKDQCTINAGIDGKHHLVMVKLPKGDRDLSRDEIIDFYIKTLAQAVGSEEEARKRMYAVSTKHFFSFGCIANFKLSQKIQALPGVQYVVPEDYEDPKINKYRGEPFVNGQAVPYDPIYHEEYLRPLPKMYRLTEEQIQKLKDRSKEKEVDRSKAEEIR